jgi:hypothetical protein
MQVPTRVVCCPHRWLKDIAKDFADMNEIWDAWIAPNAGSGPSDRSMRDGRA